MQRIHCASFLCLLCALIVDLAWGGGVDGVELAWWWFIIGNKKPH
jgi:hypothetical protein